MSGSVRWGDGNKHGNKHCNKGWQQGLLFCGPQHEDHTLSGHQQLLFAYRLSINQKHSEGYNPSEGSPATGTSPRSTIANQHRYDKTLKQSPTHLTTHLTTNSRTCASATELGNSANTIYTMDSLDTNTVDNDNHNENTTTRDSIRPFVSLDEPHHFVLVSPTSMASPSSSCSRLPDQPESPGPTAGFPHSPPFGIRSHRRVQPLKLTMRRMAYEDSHSCFSGNIVSDDDGVLPQEGGENSAMFLPLSRPPKLIRSTAAESVGTVAPTAKEPSTRSNNPVGDRGSQNDDKTIPEEPMTPPRTTPLSAAPLSTHKTRSSAFSSFSSLSSKSYQEPRVTMTTPFNPGSKTPRSDHPDHYILKTPKPYVALYPDGNPLIPSMPRLKADRNNDTVFLGVWGRTDSSAVPPTLYAARDLPNDRIALPSLL